MDELCGRVSLFAPVLRWWQRRPTDPPRTRRRHAPASAASATSRTSLTLPPAARVHLRAGGRVLVELKTVWCDRASRVLFEPIEFLEKLAAIMPRPAVSLLLYHGVLAPRADRRSPAVRYGLPALTATVQTGYIGMLPTSRLHPRLRSRMSSSCTWGT